MAAEVPVKDVLCEAMEYLSKLGSNLRIRTENLKEKKINKDKLNNALALQKAASKVLLICELSKKSLENVESGVRKILESVNTSQAAVSDVGGNSSKNQKKKSPEKPHYYSFEYKSRKLRIKKKVNIKHYMSVKVFAKKMPAAMLEKYPVYHDCKLFRLRKKRAQKRLSTENDDRDKSIIKKHHRHSSESDDQDRSDKKHHHHASDNDDRDRSDKKHCRDTSESDNQDTSNKHDESDDPDNSNKKHHRHTSPSVDITQKKSDKEDKRDSDRSERKGSRSHSRDDLKSRSSSKRIEDSPSKNQENNEVATPEDTVVSKSRRSSKSSLDKKSKVDKEDDSSNDTEMIKKSKTVPRKEVKKKRVVIESSEDEEKPNKDTDGTNNTSIDKENASNDQNINSVENGASDNNIDSMEQKLDDTNDSIQEPKLKKRKLSTSDEQASEKNNEVVTLDSSDENNESPIKNEDREKSENEHRPMLKLVSLTKLLKPDALKKCDLVQNQTKDEENKNSKQRSFQMMKKRKEKEEKEKKYWEEKRKEVKAFKPKKFTVNIVRLPKLSKCYLEEQQLRRVIQNGKIICDMDEENKADETENNEQSEALNDELVTDTNRVENALSNESESDTQINEEATKVKDALLMDSDSDSFGDKVLRPTNNDTELENKRAKDSLFQNSDSDNNKKSSDDNEQAKRKMMVSDSDNDNNRDNESENSSKNHKNDPEHEIQCDDKGIKENDENKNNGDNEKNDKSDANQEHQSENDESNTNQSTLYQSKEKDAKESLLNNSSDDKTNTPLKERRESKSVTPQSKKKHIRESIHAKKMLLTYSSSSDTDDEQLRGVIKEIKDSLLKEISDDEAKKPESPEKGDKSDSSREEFVKKIKKKIDDSDSEPKKIEKDKRKKRKRSKDGGNSSDGDRPTSRRKMVRSKSKPGNCSSSQNSDARDSIEKEIDGLTNLVTLNRVRRQNSDDSDQTQESKTSKNRKEKTKRSGLIDDDILQAETDSDGVNDENDDVEEIEEDLPSVTMSFNGVGTDHLVKEDLLVESDSSTSHNDNEKNSETNKEESEEEEKLNSKRRKANAISSDSEVGSSHKKEKDKRLSDFEDTEDENSEPVKRSKRKKKGSDSDASANSSNEGGKKKRRRIKTIDSASGSESETEGRNKHGRKNIRKVMGKNQLEEATKKAAREEKERIARIVERQKLYNNLEFDESGKPDEVVLEKVILDFDPETKEPLIEVDRGLVKKLKPHQANGIKFMWNACFESVKRIKKDKGSGCILAHCMGLGKTLQVVSLTHTLLTHGDLTGVNRVLVVCPLSTVLNWVNEFRMWLKHAESDYDLDIYELSRYKQNSERAFQLTQWLEHGGVCVLGYEMFRNLSADNTKKFKKKMLKHFQEALVDPGPDLVVCDEGHLLKNEKTSLSQSMNRVKTLRRIVLTGTPLQNNLKEYYCMVQFVKPNLLGKYNEYLNRFVNPITNGQYTDSTEHDIKIMKRRSHVLHKMLDGAVQRRDYGVLAPFLPPKHEYVLFITLTEIQVKLYQHYLDNYSRRPLAGKSSGFLFPDFQSLQRIWTHPLVLKYNSERYEIMQQKKREREEEDSEGSLVDFIDDDSTPDETSSEESSDDLSDMSDDSRKKKKKKSAKKSKGKDSKSGPRRGTRANPNQEEEDQDDVIEVKNDNPTEWWIKMVTDDEIDDMRNSHKLVLLFDILRQCEAIGDKLLVFSQSLYSLDLIEHFLGKVDEATQDGRIDEKLGGHVGSWAPGVDYFRLDGSTSCENRSIWCKNFNREDNPRARLFLISTRAGGLGINLVAANRVVIFDVSWNPSHDVQSIFRVYRFGQKKPCYIYRFLAMGTMEEKIYERQVTKQAISKRVIDEQQIDRHYAENDLAELYKFEPTPPSPRPLPPLPKDRLFAEMLKEHEAQIYKYHEHDSLLENKEEETLSEEERKAAWEDFENEKNRPPPAPFPSAWPMHNGMVPGLLAQQQQQLAYAALSAMLRKDMPNMNDNQIRDMIPLIYNSNPALMQKMSEIYKYAPGMMNPMMAGNVMNPAGGAGAMSGMSGSSGLQYEPPWQRQQQMRLQQIMQQQQNQMGAKFYAGGLGSRDPVAMALQQARAREIMLGGGGGAGTGAGAGATGRPRGRPPMQPRVPPPTSPSDVVNLDSD